MAMPLQPKTDRLVCVFESFIVPFKNSGGA